MNSHGAHAPTRSERALVTNYSTTTKLLHRPWAVRYSLEMIIFLTLYLSASIICGLWGARSFAADGSGDCFYHRPHGRLARLVTVLFVMIIVPVIYIPMTIYKNRPPPPDRN